jgi:ABC-type branched-subunit amino acid transport system ATPase component
MAQGSIFTINNLSRSFGGVNAVSDMSFDVPTGAIKAVIGPNGAGKSTLFNLITGIEQPTSGKIHFKNKKINSLKPHQRAAIGLSRTFQTHQIFGTLTVLENVWPAGTCALDCKRHIQGFRALEKREHHFVVGRAKCSNRIADVRSRICIGTRSNSRPRLKPATVER